MISSAYVTVSCDRKYGTDSRYSCETTEEINLTSLTRGSWDERHVEAELTRSGWRVEGGIHTCESCVEDEESEK